MEVSAEAKRIMVVALGKLYGSRGQRGGLRLHRSLQLTAVMKSARDIYHAAQARVPDAGLHATSPPPPHRQEEEEVEEEEAARDVPRDKENRRPAAQLSRKRRGNAAAEPDFLPCKRPKLERVGLVNQALMDYVSCSRGLAAAAQQSPVCLHRAVAAC